MYCHFMQCRSLGTRELTSQLLREGVVVNQLSQTIHHVV